MNPNTITWISFLFAIAAGCSFALARNITAFLVTGGLMVLISSVLDAIDGHVARVTNKISKKGDFLDHVIDRYADVFIIVGIILTPYCNDLLGMLGIVAVLLVSYMGTQAQAVGVGRDYSGVLGRAERLILLTTVPIIQYIALEEKVTLPAVHGYSLTFLDWLMVWFILAGNLTAVHRCIHSWRALH
jgi:archaetidylinositol phosphate synthase